MNHVEQNLTNEIVALLIQGDLHTRAIAEELNRNHVTVLRKLRDLTSDNVVDFRSEGKNKVYTLKKTLEARNAVMTAELYKQSLIVARYPILRKIFLSVGRMPEYPMVILFGSYAKGTAGKESDIDIYVETTDSLARKKIEQNHSRVSVKTGTFDTRDLLIREIMKDHIIIRGVEVYLDKTGFFTETA